MIIMYGNVSVAMQPGGVFTYMGNDTNDTMDGPNVKVVKVLPSEFSPLSTGKGKQ